MEGPERPPVRRCCPDSFRLDLEPRLTLPKHARISSMYWGECAPDIRNLIRDSDSDELTLFSHPDSQAEPSPPPARSSRPRFQLSWTPPGRMCSTGSPRRACTTRGREGMARARRAARIMSVQGGRARSKITGC